MAPREDERMQRPLEVWKYDLHVSRYMREVLGLTMKAEHAADAMRIWLHVLYEHMSTQFPIPKTCYPLCLPWRLHAVA